MTTEPQHQLISYNKKFKPGTAGVKLTFAPDEMAFSREDMPIKAAIARREVLLSLQPAIDGVSKKPWNNTVNAVRPKEPFNPQQIHVSNKNEHNPPFRPDFYDSSLPWDERATIDTKLENQKLRDFTAEAQNSSLQYVEKRENIKTAPTLVLRQNQHAQKIKKEGIPAVQPPPPFIIKKPKMSEGTKRRLMKSDAVKRHHDGVYEYSEAFGEMVWSCCGNSQKDSAGCCVEHVNVKKSREWCQYEHDFC